MAGEGIVDEDLEDPGRGECERGGDEDEHDAEDDLAALRTGESEEAAEGVLVHRDVGECGRGRGPEKQKAARERAAGAE